MSLAHLSKQLEQIESQLASSEEPLMTLSAARATKQEGVLIVTIQTVSTWMHQIYRSVGTTDPLYQKAEAISDRLKEKMKRISEIILQSINEEYETKFQFEDVFAEDPGYYYRHGILQTIQAVGVLNDLFQKLLTEKIPSHPRDEYPLARQMRRVFILHTGPTNSGKTYESLQRLKEAENGIYLSPLRLLALEVYERLKQDGVPCDLLTGEEAQFSPGARHVACTIEKADYATVFDVAVIDEGQMIADPSRGYAWSRAILGIRAKEIHICCAPEAVVLLQKLIADCADEVYIQRHHRHTPLLVEESSFTFPEDVKAGDALIVFSRKEVLRVAQSLAKRHISSSVVYGNLPPETRRKQVDLFLSGETEVVVSTDAIGMGLNLPIQRVVFLETEKFDGTEIRPLTSQEVKQIAGRAGRKGSFDRGYVNAVTELDKMKRKLAVKERDLAFAYIAPHDFTILQLPFGSLLERLKAWTQYEVKVAHFRKADISEELALLELAAEYEAILPHEALYKAITIPFNYKEADLLRQWFDYLDCLKQSRSYLPKPKLRRYNLTALETYYRAIGLYYSFSTKFGMAYDARWVRRERRKSSESIHQLLKNQAQTV
ncbi:hypothetical protein BEP19_04655 [Ammoniphilus oxalaticus]|uniref:RNA helicase n=1 Tax=Ammoniphilus oxalaticus TaxID=66863 RepID=A0A419SMB6_9BACL|nr:helicase-related protein [Ammoniphilus oxalaticus]RKD25114.1 hypothetical protein BEP19_04655 [Ammoniphilus oxalaticus]